MKEMKIYKLIISIFLFVGLSSCNDWLNIEPKDTTTETDLFATGDGYRVALNGVYAQMAESSLYGQQLNWGFLDVIAHMYMLSELSSEYALSAKYSYTDEKVKSIIEGIWSKAYNNIANCNNIIQRIDNEPAGKFAEGEIEKNVIKGEALALRAYLHLDILRLFAPSMMNVEEDKQLYIPYVTTYPCTFQPYTSNQDVLNKAIADLKIAKELVGSYDLANIVQLSPINRIENGGADDIFFAYRGYRMNYYAVCALLARVYNYAGMHQEAFNETEIVINALCDSYGSKCFTFTPSYTLRNGNTKLYEEIIFCLSNDQLWTIYKPYYGGEMSLYLNAWSADDLFDDNSDIRKKLVTTLNYYPVSIKNVEASGTLANYSKDIIPMIRLGEMYYIRAEYDNSKGQTDVAFEEMDVLRAGHSCTKGRLSGDFNQALVNEARREFIGEGQLFFYFKKFNIYPNSKYMTSELQFVLPRPDNENL